MYNAIMKHEFDQQEYLLQLELVVVNYWTRARIRSVDILLLLYLGKTSFKKNVFFRALPEWGGGGLPMPEFFGPLFLPRNSP